LSYLGEVTAAREHFEHAWGFYNPQEHNINVLQVLIDPGVTLSSYIALSLLYLGYPDQARQRHQECLTLAEELSHPYSLGFALIRTCLFHAFHQEWQLARERAEAVMRLATEQGFPFWLADGRALWGWALTAQGQIEEGIAQMEQGLAFFRATGTEVERVAHLPWLAAAYGRGGRVEEGLVVLAEALAFVNNTGMRLHEAWLHVTKGWLLLARAGDHQGEAEACFRQAIEIARRQSAKSLELRAAMSLSRLWQKQDKKEEARQMLAEIYGWFTEGFDTQDLQEAKALLAELA
jgi:predicted ATPase